MSKILSTTQQQIILQGLQTQPNEPDARVEQQDQQNNDCQQLIYPCPSHIPNSYIVRKYYCRFIAIRQIYCISLMICIFSSIIYYELDYRKDSNKALTILYFSFSNHILSLILCLLSMMAFNDWRKAEGNILKVKTIFTGFMKCLVILLQPYPWLQDTYIMNYNFSTQMQIPFKLNYLLALLSLLKSWLVIYSSVYFLKAYRIRSSKIWKKYGPSDSYIFSVKCLFKQHSILLIVFLFAFCLGFFSFSFRVSQRYQDDQGKDNLFQYYGNCVWIVFVTMTTVGYGDMAPATLWGRGFGLFCAFFGVLLVSIMVLVVINIFEMDHAEIQTLKILRRLKQKKQIRIVASQYIRLALWRVWMNKKLAKQGLRKFERAQCRQQRTKKNLLRQLIRVSKFNDASEKNLSIQMSRCFERVSFYLQNLACNMDSMISFMSQQNLIDLENMQNKSNLFGSTMIHISHN